MTALTIRMPAALGLAVVVLAGCAQAPVSEPAAPAPDAAQQPIIDFATCQRPVYPPEAAARKIEGTSTVGFLVDPNGKVVSSRIYTSSGDASLDEAVRSAISQCTFRKPLTDKGKPVRAWIPIIYDWKMD
ncbi:energy transducer TonB [Telluria beijingensis]|uniref:energy transducer TonB n=1 Tax=Telluria beijingensis TaxID=3068633 RepID=UPI0027955C41|nr:energy transducer TonB [Massilia sp. REN29]